MRRVFSRWFAVALLVGSGCGYHFSAGLGQLADGSTSLAIPAARNLTIEPRVAVWLTQALQDEALDRGLDLFPEAVHRLEVVVQKVRTTPQAVSMYGGLFKPNEQEVALTAQVSLLKGHKPRWTRKLSARATYLAAPDLRGTDTNRQLALKGLMQGLAQDVLDLVARQF